MSNVTAITPAPLIESVSCSGLDLLAESRWTEIYRLCRFAEDGVTLEDFLAAPWRVLREQGQEGAVESIRNGHRPLLPAQARVVRRLREEGYQ